MTLEPDWSPCTDNKEGVREVVWFTVNGSYCGLFKANFFSRRLTDLLKFKMRFRCLKELKINVPIQKTSWGRGAFSD